MEIVAWLKENYVDLISWFLYAVGWFLFIIKTFRVVKINELININFKARKEEAAKILQEAKDLHAQATQMIRENNEKVQKQIADMKSFYETEIEKYKTSLIEIARNDKALISKGVSETIVKRFEDEIHSIVSLYDEANILIVTHGSILKEFFSHIDLGFKQAAIEVNGSVNRLISNCSLSIVEYNQGNYRLVSYGKTYY